MTDIVYGEFNDRFLLRDIDLSDIHQLLSWRNTPESLDASPSSRKIEPIEHDRFMSRRLPQGNWWMLTHDLIGGKPVDMGVIRFDRRTFYAKRSAVRLQEAFMVNIYVDEQFRGQGVASSMIDMGVKRLKGEGLRFIALIKMENIASEVTFKKAGFSKWMTITKDVNRNDWWVYELLNKDIM